MPAAGVGLVGEPSWVGATGKLRSGPVWSEMCLSIGLVVAA